MRGRSDARSTPSAVPQAPAGYSARGLILGLVLSVLMALAVQQIALVYNAGEVESSVPPVPAVMCLLVLAGLNPLLRRVRPGWQLSRAELLTVYAALVLTVAMSGRRMTRDLLAFVTVPRYYENLADIGEQMAAWYAPDDRALVVGFFEASRDGRVPWAPWAPPLVIWTGLLLAAWLGMFCLLDLFRRRWADQEHLRFPLLYLPLQLSVDSAEMRRTFLRSPLMWVGFALGFWYALPVVLYPIWLRFPDWKVTYYPFQTLAAGPWRELRYVYLRPLPHLIGFGYLMSTDNLLTVWATYLAQQLAWVLASAYGIKRPGWHIGLEHQQAMGGTLALAGWLIWANRKALRQAAGSASRGDRWRVAGVVGGLALSVWLIQAMGAFWWMGLALVGALHAEALVYARIRSETGLPSYWALPFLFQERDFLLEVTGTRPFATGRGFRALCGFSALGWMTTGQFPQTGAYHVENVQLGKECGMGQGAMLGLSMGAILAGLLLAYWTHLSTFYRLGALSSCGAEGNGYYEVRWAWSSYNKLVSVAATRTGPQLVPNLFRLGGAGIVLALWHLRARYGSFPFTPWGYLIASSYGGTYWSSFFITWAAQRVILQYFGARVHARAIPFFLGISFGYMTATVAAVGTGFATGRAFAFGAGKRLYFDI